ncbi:helical backbone metal receptor [uncultured Ilumatobacter sp.]|uniref:helical backbone metal receptor n=1 Tax=uncultured Ilumatobacter sp. TaxID=879968 RepID=UPI00374EEE4B
MPSGRRIISLVPSSTETLLGLGGDVIACTKFCEQPDIAHVGGTKNPDIQAIIDLAPDVVVLDREENRRQDAEALEAAGIELFVSDVTDVASAMIVVAELSALVGGPTVIEVDRPRHVEPLGLSVFVPIWRRPWMSISAATYGGSLLAHLGWRMVTNGAPTAYPEVELADLEAPDVVAVPSEPYEFTDDHLDELRVAFPTSAVVRIDGQDLFWWGSRTPGAIIRLGEALCDVVGAS